jgi:hypothetical protein
MNNLHFSLDFKTTYEERKQKNIWDLKIPGKNVENGYEEIDFYQHYKSFWF